MLIKRVKAIAMAYNALYMKSIFIPEYICRYYKISSPTATTFDYIKKLYEENLVKNAVPEVTISIPAYNEEENITTTLLSLCNNKTGKPVEIVVINNNSTDNTQAIVEACGIKCILETKQGITNARNAGLAVAQGTYILNADADTIYPYNWIDEMVNPLKNGSAAITYGIFSLIPTASTGRIVYYFYEIISELSRFYNKKFKNEAVNVYGFNSGFKREQGLQVDGFNHPPGTNEDGYLALKLTNKGFGKMYRVNTAIVWTTDRRLQLDGGLFKATFKRVKRVLNIN
jgi:glycosyltransferase involved in cell wall biosynthesis